MRNRIWVFRTRPPPLRGFDVRFTHPTLVGVGAQSERTCAFGGWESSASAARIFKRGEADGLAVVKLDRPTRSVADWQTLIDGWFGERAGKQLFSVGDSIDTRTAAGRLVLNVLMSVAAWEREAIGDRTREALRHKINNGQRCGKVRFGFDLAGDGKTLVVNLVEQEAIDLMTSLRAAGHTLRQIATELTGRGIQTKEGGAWTHTAVARILQRKIAA